jgi:hypothetical protein
MKKKSGHKMFQKEPSLQTSSFNKILLLKRMTTMMTTMMRRRMPEFGDITPDDAFTPGEEEVDWSRVEELKEQIDEIQNIENPDERLQATKEWAARLSGDD